MRADYDHLVDVLHVVIGHPHGIEGDGLPRGLELGFSISDGSPCGITVIGFRRNGWDETTEELASIAEKHLAVSRTLALRAIEDAVHGEL